MKIIKEKLAVGENVFFNKETMNEVLRLCPNGDIILRGKKIANDKELGVILENIAKRNIAK